MKCSVSSWYNVEVQRLKLRNKEEDAAFISYNTFNKYYLSWRAHVKTPADGKRCCPICKFKPKRVVMDGATF
jgi:hypothetical protein